VGTLQLKISLHGERGGVSKDSGEEFFLRLSPLRGEHIFKDSLFQLAITLNVRFSSASTSTLRRRVLAAARPAQV